MFGKVNVFGLFEMILKKKSEDHIPEFGFGFGFGLGLGVWLGTTTRAVTWAFF